MNILSLCSGIGGLELGLRLAIPDVKVVCYVEIDSYCRRVLAARMRDDCLDEAPVWDDLHTFDGLPWRGAVDCITSGFPCQPFSVAGKRKGVTDERNLWPDVARVVGEVQPRIVFLENVPAILPYHYLEIRPRLSSMGYRVTEGIFSAVEVVAPHIRQRLFILAANTISTGISQQHWRRGWRQDRAGTADPTWDGEDGDVADAKLKPSYRRSCRAGWWSREPLETVQDARDYGRQEDGFAIPESLLGRVADGIPSRVDRLGALGNAVVPQVAAKAWDTLNGRIVVRRP